MHLNPAGQMVHDVWLNMPKYNPGLIQDVFAVMPNHFHAIIGLIDPAIQNRGKPAARDSRSSEQVNSSGHVITSNAPDVPGIVRKFKTYTMRKYKLGVETDGWNRYDQHLWQRSYADHIIETERDLQTHREYTFYNPLKWHLDELNPERRT